MTATLTAPTIVKPKLHDSLVATRNDWKFCRVFGRHQGEPLDIMVEPTCTGVKVVSVDHRKDPTDEVYFCAHSLTSANKISDNIKPVIGSEFTFNEDQLRQVRARAETPNSVKQIEELIATLLARDSQ